MKDELTYRRVEYDRNGNMILATYWRGQYIGDCIAYWIGHDTLMAYPKRIDWCPPGIDLKRKVYITEIEA